VLFAGIKLPEQQLIFRHTINESRHQCHEVKGVAYSDIPFIAHVFLRIFADGAGS
jgi:hypothetical protein